MKNYNSGLHQDITLLIDTSSSKEIIVGLEIDGKEDKVKQEVGAQKAQVVLPLIDKLLKKHQLRINDLRALKAHTGPGSFTGLRVGVAIANALSSVLGIPINGKAVGKIVVPTYE